MVFEAYDESLRRQVALKAISAHLADDPDLRARFTREAQAQASLDSAHVVHVYAHGDAEGRLYIATQLVPDGDLGLMLQAYGAPAVRTALDVIAQVATGLADAHDAGLVHRDIKPADVLLRRRDATLHAYLADFGIARQVGADATAPTTPTDRGSPASGPDEQRAVDGFATALAATSVMSDKQPGCVARTLVEDIGLPTLVEDGFFDGEGNFLDPDLAGLPAEKDSLSTASLSCLTLD